jgi:hypothetical protein
MWILKMRDSIEYCTCSDKSYGHHSLLDKRGRVIGIEVIDASKNLGKELVNKILNTEKMVVTA